MNNKMSLARETKLKYLSSVRKSSLRKNIKTESEVVDERDPTIDLVYQTMAGKNGTLQECYTKDDIDYVLCVTDEFMDDERIQEVLYACDQGAWDHVYENRFKYSPNIRGLIEPRDYLHSAIRMKLRDLTDLEVARIEREMRDSKMKEFEPVWVEIQKTLTDRPVDEMDDNLDDIWTSLEDSRKRLDNYIAKKNGKYVPPGARRDVDDDQKDIEDEISDIQKEFDNLQKRISEEDEKYMKQKKNEHFEEWLRQV